MKPKVLDKQITVKLNDYYLKDIDFLAEVWKVNRSQAIRIAIMTAKMELDRKEKTSGAGKLGETTSSDKQV